MQINTHRRPAYDACLETPFTRLGLRFSDGALCHVDFLQRRPRVLKPGVENEAACVRACEQILDYCTAHPHRQFDLLLELQGTDFQKKVWNELRNIPVGSVTTYGELAQRLNSSARAVGNACRHNPVPLVIPCHRVVAKNGIGGFVGDTEGRLLRIKQSLLAHEGVQDFS